MFVRWSRKRRKDQFVGYQETGEYRKASDWLIAMHPEYEGKLFPVKERVIREEYLLTAAAVESYRNAEGKPRQRTVCYLGSIRERHLDLASDYSVSHRGHFWEGAEARLAAANVPDDDREAIIAALEDRVPRPAAEDVERRRAETEERIAAIARMAGRRV